MPSKIEEIYDSLSKQFSDTLKKTSEDINKTTADRYMTLCEEPVVNLDVMKIGKYALVYIVLKNYILKMFLPIQRLSLK